MLLSTTPGIDKFIIFLGCAGALTFNPALAESKPTLRPIAPPEQSQVVQVLGWMDSQTLAWVFYDVDFGNRGTMDVSWVLSDIKSDRVYLNRRWVVPSDFEFGELSPEDSIEHDKFNQRTNRKNQSQLIPPKGLRRILWDEGANKFWRALDSMERSPIGISRQWKWHALTHSQNPFKPVIAALVISDSGRDKWSYRRSKAKNKKGEVSYELLLRNKSYPVQFPPRIGSAIGLPEWQMLGYVLHPSGKSAAALAYLPLGDPQENDDIVSGQPWWGWVSTSP